MAELDELENELSTSLTALEFAGEKPCKCHGTGEPESENPFSDVAFGAHDLADDLDLALSSISGADPASQLSAEEAMEFAMMEDLSGLRLEDVVSLTEKYPGLKVTFSH